MFGILPKKESWVSLLILILTAILVLELKNQSYKCIVALSLSCILSSLITYWGTTKLRKLRVGQVIRKEGPEEHQSKSGTPTMGGILFIPIGLLIGNLMSIDEENSNQILAISMSALGFLFVGWFDDYLSLLGNKNTGLKPIWKLFLQIFFSCIFLFWSYSKGWILPEVGLFGNTIINLGILVLPVSLFALIAESNATNLTDGLDGLATGCGTLVFAGLSIELMIRGGNNEYNIAIFSISMAGALLGFLSQNRYPARIFMGDTGSLSIGATLASIGIISNSLWSLLIMGGIFFSESISVIAQVLVFKATKKLNGRGLRLLRMAPVHHHFELVGVKENKIVQNFWIANIGFIVLGLILRSTG